MAIEKMTLINIKGPLERLDDVILKCSDLGCFHPEDITPAGNVHTKFEQLNYHNPYQALLNGVTALAGSAGIELLYKNVTNVVVSRSEIRSFVQSKANTLAALQERRGELLESVRQHENVLTHLRHLKVMDLSFDQIFPSVYLKVRFGRLPRDSEPKLSYYNNKVFLFLPFDEDSSYIWSAYFTTPEYVSEIDDIFSSLFFERVHVPDYVHGKPQDAIDHLEKQYQEEKRLLAEKEQELSRFLEELRAPLLETYAQVLFLSSTYDLRRYVGVSKDTFFMVGFIPKSREKDFSSALGVISEVALDLLPEDNDKRFIPPTKLKNNRLVEPFEMFVKMYGLPSHRDIDPTPYIAVVYSLLFGIMFGDLGQGLLVSALGFVLYRWKKMELGRIMERIGLSSAFFGLLYGSVFGFEHALDPLFHALGFAEKPIEVMDANTINTLLIGAVGLGAVIIVTSIAINILLGIRQKDWGRAVFSQNGAAGLLFYGTVLIGVLSMMTGGAFFNPLTVSLGVVLPLAVIFFKDPILHLIERAQGSAFEDGVGSFIAQSFFELFEVVLSFVANTMSFLRVGGFILSHAGMMAVVFTISGMVSAGASPIVIILGNLFVMALEGLIVGIQVLRLQFYEMFSRFFGGEGEPFEPISVEMSAR